MKSTPSVLATFLGMVVLCGSGCTSWQRWSSKEDEAKPGTVTTSPLRNVTRSIEIESEFIQIRFDPKQPDQLQSIWQWVDETVIPPETRKMLAKNGLRAGQVIHSERMTSRIEQLGSVDPPDVVDEFLASAAVSSHQSEGADRIPIRLGKRYEIPVRLPIEGEQVVMVQDGGQLVGETLIDPQFLFALKASRDASPGRIQLRLRPEIQHGDMRHSWVTGDAALRIDVRRPTWSLGELEFDFVGGETDQFVIAETPTRRGLGRQMLGGEDVEQLEQQTIVLLRVINVPTPAER